MLILNAERMIKIIAENKKKKSFSEWILALFSGSLIIGLLLRFTDFIYIKAAESLIGRCLTGRDPRRSIRPFGFSVIGKRRKHPNQSAARKFFMRGFEQSAILRSISGFMSSLLYKTVKYYGIFFLSFGLCSCLASFVIGQSTDGRFDTSRLAVGIGLIVAGVLMLFNDVTLGEVLCESRGANLILFGFFGARRDTFAVGVSEKKHKGYTACAFGIFLGAVSFYIEPYILLMALVAAIMMYIVLLSPETGTLLMIVLLPFVPTMFLVALTIWTVFSFVIKLIRGKRTLKFESFDVAVLVFMAIMLLGGLVSVSVVSSLKSAAVFLCFMSGYFLVVNLINTAERVERCVNAMLLSSLAVALYGIVQYVTGSADSMWQDTNMFSDISGRVVSTFSNPNVLAEYLIMMLPIAGAMMITSAKKAKKAFYPLTFVTLGICLIFTWSRGAWLGFIIAAILFMLMWSKKFMVLGICGVAALPLMPFVLPANIVARFASIGNLSDSSTSYRVSIWRGVAKVLDKYAFSGIGVGSGAFTSVYPLYSYEGIEFALHSHSLFFQITVELGIIGLIALAVLMLLFARNTFSFFVRKDNLYLYSSDSGKKFGFLSAAGMCGIFGVLLQGIADYVWYDYRVFLMFWLLIGITVTVGRTVQSDTLDPDDLM